MAAKKSDKSSNVKLELLYALVETSVEKLDSLKDDLNRLDKKVDLQIQKNEYEFKRIQTLDEEQNRILDEHHQRSTELKRDNELREQELKALLNEQKVRLDAKINALSTRVSKIELPQRALWWIKRVFVWVAALGTATVTLVAAFKALKGL